MSVIRYLGRAYQRMTLAYSAGRLAMDALTEMNESNQET